MSTIGSTGNPYPKNFYDNGGGSYGGIQPNKIMSGVLQGQVMVGPNGPTFNPGDGTIDLGGGSIVGSTFVINSGGISIGGVTINPAQLTPRLKGPLFYSYTSTGITAGDGFPLVSFDIGDILIGSHNNIRVTFNNTAFFACFGWNMSDSAAGDPTAGSWMNHQVNISPGAGVPTNSADYLAYTSGGMAGVNRGGLVLTTEPMCVRINGTNATQGEGAFYVMYYPYSGGYTKAPLP